MELVGSDWQACGFQAGDHSIPDKEQREEKRQSELAWMPKNDMEVNRLPHRVKETHKSVDTVLTLFKVSIEATCPSHERNPVFPADPAESQQGGDPGLRDER